jgi:hypothetical protein
MAHHQHACAGLVFIDMQGSLSCVCGFILHAVVGFPTLKVVVNSTAAIFKAHAFVLPMAGNGWLLCVLQQCYNSDANLGAEQELCCPAGSAVVATAAAAAHVLHIFAKAAALHVLRMYLDIWQHGDRQA